MPFPRNTFFPLAFFLTLGLTSCAGNAPPLLNSGSSHQQRLPAPSYKVSTDPTSTTPRTTPLILPGNNLYTASIASESAEQETLPDGEFALNLNNADLASAANIVLGQILKQNYVIDQGLKATITLQTVENVSAGDILAAFKTALEGANLALVSRTSGYRITSSANVSRRFQQTSRNASLGQSLFVIPLKHIGAAEMAEMVQSLNIGGRVLSVQENRNLFIVSANGNELAGILDAVETFDTDIMAGRSFALLPVANANPEDLVLELETVFDAQSGGALEGLVRFIPNTRLASILVIAQHSDYLEAAQNWVARLDKAAQSAQQNLFVYNVQNRTAKELVPLLKALLSQGTQTETTRTDAENETAPIMQTSLSPSNSEQIKKTVQIVADDEKNAILFYATRERYDAVLQILEQIDTIPNQVLIETTIAEVTLKDELKFGLRWFFENSDFSVGFSNVSNGAVASAYPGFSALFPSTQAKVALNALSSITDVNVVSTPNLVVLDNRTAKLRIGDEVPVATQSSVNSSNPNAPIVNTIAFKNTGIILTVTPRVNNNGRVILEIVQEVSDVTETTSSGIDSPTIQQRKIETTIVINDGESLALGGLIQDHDNVIRTKVPVLGDIPVLGSLFRNTDNTQRRTELLIIITPQVIRDTAEARAVTEEFRANLKGLNQPDTPNGFVPEETLQRIFN